MKIRKLRQIDVLFLAVIVTFVLNFGDIKYAFAAVFVVIYLLLMALHERRLLIYNEGKMFSTILIGICILTIITVFKQICNGFQSYAVNEIIYFITPLFFVWIYVSNTNTEKLAYTVDILFVVYAGCCLAGIIPKLTIENIKGISYRNSASVFESGYAYIFLIFEWFYFYIGNKKRAIISLVLSILSFKRFCLVAACVLFLFSKGLINSKPVRKELVNAVIIAFVVLPFVTCIALSQDFAKWFQDVFGVSLEKLTLTRSTRIVMLMESNEIKYGLGSSTVFLTKVFQQMHNSKVEQWNLHNDVVRIYLECGILGSIAFTWSYFKAMVIDRGTLILMIYIFSESFFNHLFGAGSVPYWTLTYLVVAYVIKRQQLSLKKEYW